MQRKAENGEGRVDCGWMCAFVVGLPTCRTVAFDVSIRDCNPRLVSQDFGLRILYSWDPARIMGSHHKYNAGTITFCTVLYLTGLLYIMISY